MAASVFFSIIPINPEPRKEGLGLTAEDLGEVQEVVDLGVLGMFFKPRALSFRVCACLVAIRRHDKRLCGVHRQN